MGRGDLGISRLDHLAKATRLLLLLRQSGQKITTAESCTGGLIAAALTEVAGSSDMFDRGFVTYSNASKIQMLGVKATSLDEFGAVSEKVALEMAGGALLRSDANLALSVTGIAGPGGSDFKPEGRVCFALAARGKPSQVTTIEFGAIGRAEVRAATVSAALDMLIRAAL